MKKVFLSAALTAAMAVTGIPVIAQSAPQSDATGTTQNAPMRGHRGFHRGNPMQHIAKKLNLSQDQQNQLQPIFQNQRQQMQAIRQDTSLTPDQRKAKIEALRQDTHNKVNSVLTPEQQQQWAQMKAQGKQRMEARREKMGERLAQKLNLSQDQQNQIKPIMQQQREQAKAIWQDTSLTKDQKREKMQALHQSTQTQMNAILTPEQQQQWQQMRQNFRGHRHGRGPAGGAQPTPQG